MRGRQRAGSRAGAGAVAAAAGMRAGWQREGVRWRSVAGGSAGSSRCAGRRGRTRPARIHR